MINLLLTQVSIKQAGCELMSAVAALYATVKLASG